jgi:hypothetical protein
VVEPVAGAQRVERGSEHPARIPDRIIGRRSATPSTLRPSPRPRIARLSSRVPIQSDRPRKCARPRRPLLDAPRQPA